VSVPNSECNERLRGARSNAFAEEAFVLASDQAFAQGQIHSTLWKLSELRAHLQQGRPSRSISQLRQEWLEVEIIVFSISL